MNAQQKLEKTISKARKELAKLKADNPLKLTDGLAQLNQYLAQKNIVKSFGKVTIASTVEAEYTKKDNSKIPVLEATLSNNKVFIVTPSRFWMKKQ